MNLISDYMSVLPIIQAVFFIALLCIASIYDIKYRMIPDLVNLFILFIGIMNINSWKILGIFCAIPFFIGAMKDGIGGGDVKLMGATGVVLGLHKGIIGTIIGLGCVLIYYGMVKGIKGKCSKNLPLAPFLSIGCIIAFIM